MSGAWRRVMESVAEKRSSRSDGSDEISEPERGEENFAETSDEEHLTTAVETLEGGDGAAGIAEFAVVIVFQN